MPIINGIAIVWGLPDFGITESSVGALNLQSAEHTKNDSPEIIKDSAGKRCTTIWPDPVQNMTLEYYVRAVAGTNTAAGAKLQTKLPAPGTLLTLTFTATEYVGVSTGLVWELQEGTKQSMTNTGAIKISLPLLYASGVTVVAT